MNEVTWRSAGDPSRLNRAASRRSSLRFGRNTPGIPPSRALSAGRLAGLGAHVTSSTGRSQPKNEVTWRSAGDPSRLNRAASRRSSLRFGRNTPGIPPSRALSAGRLADLGAHVTSSTGRSQPKNEVTWPSRFASGWERRYSHRHRGRRPRDFRRHVCLLPGPVRGRCKATQWVWVAGRHPRWTQRNTEK